MALAIGTTIVAVLYVGLNMVFIYATSVAAMGSKPDLAPGAVSAINLFGPSIGGIWAGLMAACLMSTVSAEVTVGPRVYYAMAKNRAFFSAAARVHPRFHTPIVAIIAQGACAMLMTATPFPDLVNYIGMSLTLFTVLSVASLLVFRRRQPGWQRLRAVDFAFPLIPASYILVGTAMVIFGLKEHPWASLSAFATVGAGALVYRIGVRPAA
jgi:APA family basic amino acid/polyamine antiporter